MKKQNRLFSGALYREGLRQIRLISILAFVIFELEAILNPLGQFIGIQSHIADGYIPSVETLDFLSVHPLLITTFCVLAPLLTLTLFHFLNKRSTSDFYHSIPHTRVSLFFSFAAAILTWILGIMVVTTATAVGLFALMPQFFALNLTGILAAFFNLFAASCLVVASITIAMAVTGTTFTNIVVSCLILFLPRLLLTGLAVLIGQLLPIIHADDLFGNSFNVVTQAVFGTLLGSDSGLVSSTAGGLYTLGLALVYFLLAAWLFHRRKSEAAGQAAQGRGLQLVFRLAISLPVCLFPCAFVLMAALERTYFGVEELFLCFVLWLVAVLIYFLYELISTRRWKNLVRAVPGLGILALLNVAAIFTVMGVYHAVLNVDPDVDDIQSVQILSDSNDYFAQKTNDICCDDPVIRQVVADALHQSIADIRANQFSTDAREAQRVSIHLKGRTINRRLYLTAEQRQTIVERLSLNEDYKKALLELPDSRGLSTAVKIDGMTSAQALAIYETLRAEVPEKGFETWYGLVFQDSYYQYPEKYVSTQIIDDTDLDQSYSLSTYFDMTTVYIHVSTTVGTQSADFSVPLSPLYPRTAQLYLQYLQKNMPVQEAVQSLRQVMEDDYFYLSVGSGGFGFSLNLDRHKWGNETTAAVLQEMQALADWLEQAAAEPIGLDTPVMELYINTPYNMRSLELYVAIEEVPDCLKRLYLLNNGLTDEWFDISGSSTETSEESAESSLSGTDAEEHNTTSTAAA